MLILFGKTCIGYQTITVPLGHGDDVILKKKKTLIPNIRRVPVYCNLV